MTRLHASEHEVEPQPGLPERLPAGEQLLWQGAPDARVLAWRGFHLPWFGGYFALLLAWQLAAVVADGGGAASLVTAAAWTLLPAALVLGFIALLARLVSRTSLYTLTDRRLVLRIGVVLSVTFNLPLRRIEAAEVRRHGHGAGDIALRLVAADRIGVAHLWPHVRPWRFTRAEPMLRALPDADAVARLLAEALSRSLQADERGGAALGAAPAAPRAAGHGPLPHAA